MNHPSSTYAPDDAKITVQSLEFLHSTAGRPLLDAARALISQTPAPSVAAIAALRKLYPAEYLHAALTLAQLQEKGTGPHGKFPDLPFVWATPEALQQSTHASVAHHKAARFAAASPHAIIDLCAGVGGDTLALAQVAPVTAIDLSPIRTTCLRFNAADLIPSPPHSLNILTEDICTTLPQFSRKALFHIDPARRSAGKRSPHYADLIPSPKVLDQVIHHFIGGVIKLSPAVDFESLPSSGHLELISHLGSVVQALLWIGKLAELFPKGTRTATLIPQNSRQGAPTPFTALPGRAVVPESATQFLIPRVPEGMCLYELDGAWTRAALAAPFATQHHLLPLTSDGGYLLTPPSHPRLVHPALTPFDLLSIIPYSENRVIEALAQNTPILKPAPSIPIEVKSRGYLPGIDTDKLQITWSQSVPVGLTVLLFPFRKDVLAAIARRPRS